jgi:circadian clock protein KaiB
MEKKQGSQIESVNAENSCYIFRLYITGASPNSSRAITNLKSFLERHLKDQYKLEIIDVYQQPQIAKSVDIIALPMLIREYPHPPLRLIGDLSNEEKLAKVLMPINLNL